jgi:hypothetical protein
MQHQSSEEVVCQSIMDRFPNAELKESVVDGSKVFQISQLGNIVIVIDRIGAEFHFPTRGRPEMKWSDILEGGPVQVADMILRDMADAGFQVLSEHGKLIEKSQIRIGKFTFCPKCNEMGKVKEILYGMPSEDYNQNKYVLGGCCVEENDPEIQCTECDWVGMMEEVRFTKRKAK